MENADPRNLRQPGIACDRCELIHYHRIDDERGDAQRIGDLSREQAAQDVYKRQHFTLTKYKELGVMLDGSKRDERMAVSYTHLDVYKRQDQDDARLDQAHILYFIGKKVQDLSCAPQTKKAPKPA